MSFSIFVKNKKKISIAKNFDYSIEIIILNKFNLMKIQQFRYLSIVFIFIRKEIKGI